jgi:hypothetical protein
MNPSPSAAKLLADLADHGIDLQAHGDAIRFRPRQAMTPELLRRLQSHKAELLAITIIKQAHDLGNANLAEALAEAWAERIAICVEDGKESQATAESLAAAQLRMMIDRAKVGGSA